MASFGTSYLLGDYDNRGLQTQCGVNSFILDSRRVLAPAPKVTQGAETKTHLKSRFSAILKKRGAMFKFGIDSSANALCGQTAIAIYITAIAIAIVGGLQIGRFATLVVCACTLRIRDAAAAYTCPKSKQLLQ